MAAKLTQNHSVVSLVSGFVVGRFSGSLSFCGQSMVVKYSFAAVRAFLRREVW